MKYIVFLGDGMADIPLKDYEGKTPLELAKKPNIDYIASHGICGMVKTVPEGMKPGSDVANLSVMGFNPIEVYSGRAPLEALSIGIKMADGDVALRCNLVTLSDEEDYADKTMLDYSAGEISTEEAHELMRAVNDALGSDGYEFFGGVSYRNCLIINGGSVRALTAPHDITGQKIGGYLPGDKVLLELERRSYEILSNHPVNIKRAAEGKNPANSIWLWGAGVKPNLPDFGALYGLKGAVISAVDLLKGIAIGSGMDVIEVPGATGRLDTNWAGKAEAAIKAINGEYDYVYVHMEAPDECGHQGDVKGKIAAIEHVDRLIGETLDGVDLDNITIMILPDHPTPAELGTHTGESVPFVMYRHGIEEKGAASYSEKHCAETGIFYNGGEDLMRAFLAVGEQNISDEPANTSIDANIATEEAKDSDSNDEKADIMSEEHIDGGDAEEIIEEPENNESAADEGVAFEESEADLTEAEYKESTDTEEESRAESPNEAECEITAVEEENNGEARLILPDEAPLLEDKEEIREESNESGKEKKKRVKLKKKQREKTTKPKKELTKEQKKKRIIAISVLSALLIIAITLSITLPIVLLNRGKIFINSAADFSNTDGEYYVLNKDIVVDGDLTLPRAYTIDMNGHNLTVNGTMIIGSDTEVQLDIGKRSGKINGVYQYSNDGVLTAGKLEISVIGTVNIHAVLKVKELSVKNASANFYASEVNDLLTLEQAALDMSKGVIFSENGKANIINSTLIAGGKAAADYTLSASKLYVNAGAETKSLTLDGSSRAHIYGVVNGSITGGERVVLGKTAEVRNLSGMKEIWLSDSAVYDRIDGNVKVESIIELVAPPTLTVSVENDGRILVYVKTVSNGARYECMVGDKTLPLQSGGENGLTVFDITSEASLEIGEIRISVRALGAEGSDPELIIPSEYTTITYEHKITLATPKDLKIVKEADKYVLSFSPVNFANNYKIEINGREVLTTNETTLDITAFLKDVGNYSVFVRAVNTDNAAILESEKALTGYEVRRKLIISEMNLETDENGGVTLHLTAENAKDMLIEYTDIEGNVIILRTAYKETYYLGRLKPQTDVKVTLLTHGYYDESEMKIVNYIY